VNTALLARAAGIQVLFVGVLFAVLALTVPHHFFDEHGAIVGPLAWIVCSLATGRLLRLSPARTVLAALAGGLVAGLVGVAVDHVVSLPLAVVAFALVCASDQPSAPQRA
jgi:uncharacterized membrane protein